MSSDEIRGTLDLMKKLGLFLVDAVLFYGALALVISVRYADSFRDDFYLHLIPFSILFIVWVLVFFISNLYEISQAKNDTQFYGNFFYAIAVSAAISVMFFYLISFFGIAPKTNLFLFLIFYTGLGVLWRYIFNQLISKSGQHNNTLIIGNNEQSQDLYDHLLANPQLGYNVLGIIDISDATVASILENLIIQKKVKTLVLSPEAYKIPRIIEIFYKVIGRGIVFSNLSDFYERTTSKIPLGSIDQIWFLQNLSEGSKRGYELLKRFFDVVFSVLIGLITLPFYPLITLSIKLDSRGPVFFKQARVGRTGKPFTLVKFRNMVANSPDGSAEAGTGPVWASANDPRVTRVGRFIRKTRIDELPQLWNVLKGDMSFVGPRPERPEFHEQLKKEVPFYEERYLIKPGLTGWAQLKYKLDFKGGMTIRDTFEKLQYDLYYIKNRSIFLDLAIILKTLNKLIRQSGK